MTKQQLLEAVWPGTFVGDAVLKDSIRQVREALGDDATSPIYIATSHRRGYRFIGHFSQAAASPVASPVSPSVLGFPKGLHDATPVAPRLLGRNAELAAMRGWLERAWRGERQIAFITGEAGIGKTTLVNALVEHVVSLPRVHIVRGQCLQHYGHAEAYLPVLDGLSQCCRGPDGTRVIDLLRQYAPAWLPQLGTLFPGRPRAAAPELPGIHS